MFYRFFIGFFAFAFLVPGIVSAQEVLELNDTFYPRQWYMRMIHADQAWAKTATSSREVVVAVVDSGVDWTHPDLKGALWTDPDEPINGKDDDKDGFIDDAHGWNFFMNSSNTRPIADHGEAMEGAWEHGTIVSSLIAARGNDDIGIAGVHWSVKLMPLVILGSDGSGDTGQLVEAIHYAIAHRADIINLSLEGDADPQVTEAITKAVGQGILVVAASGNGLDGFGFDLDVVSDSFPSCANRKVFEGLLVVTAVGEDGMRLQSANYGSCVDLSAPGGELFVARPTYDPDGNDQMVSGYGVWSGTSLSAPLVTGVAALLKSRYPSWTGSQISRRLLETAEAFTTPFSTDGMGKGLLDASSALETADPTVYGPWQLFASSPGQMPMVWLVGEDGSDLYSIPVGNPGDRRGIRSAFVHWDTDEFPEILVTDIGDTTGSWRVYRRDGVLLAAGQIGSVAGGLYLSTQDLDQDGQETVLFAEANGPRFWLLEPGGSLNGPHTPVDSAPWGLLPIGVKRPAPSFILLARSNASQMFVWENNKLEEGLEINTGNPALLQMSHLQSSDNREVVRLEETRGPKYLLENLHTLSHGEPVGIWRSVQDPQGLPDARYSGRRFFDVWPR